MARLLRVSASGFYAWRERTASKHARSDADLSARIRSIYLRSRETYGPPRIHDGSAPSCRELTFLYAQRRQICRRASKRLSGQSVVLARLS